MDSAIFETGGMKLKVKIQSNDWLANTCCRLGSRASEK